MLMVEADIILMGSVGFLFVNCFVGSTEAKKIPIDQDLISVRLKLGSLQRDDSS